MKTKTLQYFSKDYLKSCKKMKPYDILVFLDEFRQVYGGNIDKIKQNKLTVTDFDKKEK